MKRITVCLSACLIASLPSVGSAETLRTVALSGDHAPGTPSGVTYEFFLGNPLLNSAGQTAFRGRLTGDGVDNIGNTNSTGIWSEGSGSLGLVVRAGDHAPGTPIGVNYISIGEPLLLNSVGQTAFHAYLRGDLVTSQNDTGIWSEASGALGLVAREGDHAPGTPSGAIFYHFGSAVLNSAGQTAFSGRLLPSFETGIDRTNQSGIWSEGSGSLSLVARGADHAPGTPSGVNFAIFPRAPVLNSAGQTAFLAALTGTDVDTSNNFGIWRETSGSLDLVARKGDHAPGTPTEVDFRNLYAPVLNSAGQTAFGATLSFNGGTISNGQGIWSEASGSLGLVVRGGDHAPGTPSGVNFSFLSERPVLNSAGHTAFSGGFEGDDVDTTNNTGIWSEGFGSLGLVAREGDRAPGTPIGVRFSDVYDSSVVLNSAGQTAFTGLLTGSDVDSTNDFGIWAQDRAGSLRLIARHGDQLEVIPGDYRTIERLFFDENLGRTSNTGNEDGRHSGFNDLGQLAFSAIFTDGTRGVFVSSIATVPEPGALGLLLFGVIACGVHRRRR